MGRISPETQPKLRLSRRKFLSGLAAAGGIALLPRIPSSIAYSQEPDTPTPESQIAFTINIDPLTKKPHPNPNIPMPPESLGSNLTFSQLEDGRVVTTEEGKIVARARYYPWRNEWRWRTSKIEFDYTPRELADARQRVFGILDGDLSVNNMSHLNEAQYVDAVENIANQLIIGLACDTRIVFGRFTNDEWQKVLLNWNQIEQDLDAGRLPEDLPYSWDQANRMVEFAEKEGMSIRAQHLMWGKDILDSVYNGTYSNEELEKILKFMVKTRVIKYKGRVQEWDCADEAAVDIIFGHGKQNGFWYDKFGEEIIGKVASWVKEADPSAKTAIVEDQVTQTDTENFRKIGTKFFQILQQLKDSGAPVDKVGIEQNLWIYAAPSKDQIKTTLTKITDMGFQIASSEATVNIAPSDPFWTNRKTVQVVPNPQEVQAQVLGDLLEVYDELNADFGLGGISDKTGWLSNVGHPETQAMILDQNLNPKPAYYATLKVLRNAVQFSTE